MPTVAMTEKDLRAAIRDPRDWTSGHPEREDWAAWTTEGWRALVEGSPSTGPDGQQVVHVRAYERRRGGRSHRVGA